MKDFLRLLFAGSKFGSASTLRVQAGINPTAALVVLFVPLLFLALEAALRLDFVQPYLDRLIPSLGGRHLQMEGQLGNLAQVQRFEGRVDCIFLGSSLVWLGLDPQVFEETYEAETGQAIRCFNLGIETLPAYSAAAIAEVVVKEYQPALLIYGTSARDYAVELKAEDAGVVLDTPWLRYQLGRRTPLTWLATHSYVFRYARSVGNIIRQDEETLGSIRNTGPIPRGHLAKTRPAQPVHFEAGARDAARWLQPYVIRPENQDGLARIAQLHSAQLTVLIVEMPVSDAYFGYFTNGRQDYERFAAMVRQTSAEEGVSFLRPPKAGIEAEDGWWDFSHLNQKGAVNLSQWLAEYTATLEIDFASTHR